MSICENCGSEHNGSYGSGRFCSTKCSRSFSTKNNRAETNEKIRFKMSKTHEDKLKKCICIECGNYFLAKRRLKTCSTECLNKIKNRSGNKSVNTRRERGTFSGWPYRKGEQSYPEKYIENFLVSNGKNNFVKELKVGKWFIDFAFTDQKVAIEVDGGQHNSPDRKEKDKEKDSFLNSLGWNVLRIQWVNPINKKNQDCLYPQLVKILEISV